MMKCLLITPHSITPKSISGQKNSERVSLTTFKSERKQWKVPLTTQIRGRRRFLETTHWRQWQASLWTRLNSCRSRVQLPTTTRLRKATWATIGASRRRTWIETSRLKRLWFPTSERMHPRQLPTRKKTLTGRKCQLTATQATITTRSRRRPRAATWTRFRKLKSQCLRLVTIRTAWKGSLNFLAVHRCLTTNAEDEDYRSLDNKSCHHCRINQPFLSRDQEAIKSSIIYRRCAPPGYK